MSKYDIVAEMNAIMSGDTDALAHYGKGHKEGGHSGRYPWGSGDDGYQRANDFLDRVERMRRDGCTYTDPETGKVYTGDTAIAKTMHLSSTEFRTHAALAKDTRRMYLVSRAKKLSEEGKNTSEIARIMGVNESTVRSWYNAKSESRMKEAMNTADFIREQINTRGMIDVGTGVERELKISREKLEQALTILQAEGYPVYGGGIPQVTNKGQQTNQKVICPPGTEYKAIYEHDKVNSLNQFVSRDDGDSFEPKFHYPESMDSSRLMIRYRDDGGIEKDGVVELRRGCADLSLGESRYSQVRILVDGTHYIKGMAVYGDDKDFPPGVDAIFNTNKGSDKSKMDVLKPIHTEDPMNPFGSAIKDADQGGQYWYNDPKSGEKKLGLINKRADEGDWMRWSDTLPSQFLAKQNIGMIKKQLGLAKADAQDELSSIMAVNNTVIRNHLLEKFADGCDSSAVNLKAAPLPGQKYHVLIPIPTMKDNEIFAPNYENGTKLALVRYPHAGTFEIPILTVNNKHADAQKVLGTDVPDVVGINSKVAERLSGADFDGDAVMAIPTHGAGTVKVTSRPYLDGLVGFDPKLEYPKREGMKFMQDPVTKADSTQMEMGKISNLITDMTVQGAPDSDMVKAVRHSMVVIDAKKHQLDYKQSEIDNEIDRLKRTYQQKGYDENGNLKYGGAGTLLSRAKGEESVDKRQGTYKINEKGKPYYDPTRPEGAKLWKTATDLYYPDREGDKAGNITIRTTDGKKITYNKNNPTDVERYTPVKRVAPDGTVTYTSKDGSINYKLKKRTQPSDRMSETDDARTLIGASKSAVEVEYASYANSMKALANSARLTIATTPTLKVNKEAKKQYAAEVQSLNDKLDEALRNAPRERQAQRAANAQVSQIISENPDISKGDLKKAKQRALTQSRVDSGSVNRRARNIDITDNEWKAIQSGAVSENTLKKILANTDIDKLRERATPSDRPVIRDSQIARAKAMLNAGYTLAEVSKKLGVSPSTLSKKVKGE